MTGILDERERAYEASWAIGEETRFELLVRRNRRLGQWAAQMMKLPPRQCDRYADSVVRAGLVKGADRVFEKVGGDLAAHKVSLSEPALRRKMQDLFDEAEAELLKSVGPRNGNLQ